jgi:hypothetical protein
MLYFAFAVIEDSSTVQCFDALEIDVNCKTVVVTITYYIFVYLQRNAYRILVGKPEGRRPLGRPRRRWVDNIRMDLGEVGWGDVDWIGVAKDRNR